MRQAFEPLFDRPEPARVPFSGKPGQMTRQDAGAPASQRRAGRA